MKRRLIGTWIMGAVVVLAAAGLLSSTANAQSTLQFVGSFTLPCETTWNDAVLPAGDYTLSIRTVASSEFIRVDSAQGSKRIFVPEWPVGDKQGNKDVLLLTRTGNHCVVRALNLADLDMEITYKPLTREEMASLRSGKPGSVIALVLFKH
jgi:hypothetical protein